MQINQMISVLSSMIFVLKTSSLMIPNDLKLLVLYKKNNEKKMLGFVKRIVCFSACASVYTMGG